MSPSFIMVLCYYTTNAHAHVCRTQSVEMFPLWYCCYIASIAAILKFITRPIKFITRKEKDSQYQQTLSPECSVTFITRPVKSIIRPVKSIIRLVKSIIRLVKSIIRPVYIIIRRVFSATGIWSKRVLMATPNPRC